MFGKGQPQLTREQSLAALPVRNGVIREERTEKDDLVLRVPVKRKGVWRVLGRFLNIPEVDRRVELDELGAYVWGLCDGQTDVRTIIDRFSRQYKLNRKEAEVSMTAYLRTLARRRLIGIMVSENGSASKGSSPRARRRTRGKARSAGGQR